MGEDVEWSITTYNVAHVLEALRRAVLLIIIRSSEWHPAPNEGNLYCSPQSGAKMTVVDVDQA